MTDQLFTEPMPAVQPLPPNQDTVMRLLNRHLPQGITGDEAGAAVHAQRGKHPADERCVFCGQDGKQVLRALARKGLATGRRDGYWTPPGPTAKREHERALADAQADQAAPEARPSSIAEDGFPVGF